MLSIQLMMSKTKIVPHWYEINKNIGVIEVFSFFSALDFFFTP